VRVAAFLAAIPLELWKFLHSSGVVPQGHCSVYSARRLALEALLAPAVLYFKGSLLRWTKSSHRKSFP
jgi:hypothetical protein